MPKGITVPVMLLAYVLLATSALAQSGSSSAQQAQAAAPLFRVVVVGRTAKAINFRPRGGETKINFVGTALSPRAHGDATVEGKDGYIEIDANFETLQSPRTFGPEFLTYVLWAITPEGRASNLGELQASGDDGELRVTTELQAFGLIVTAEPYFAVTQPSDVVVLESTPREEGVFQDRTVGRIEAIDAKYELLSRGSYLLYQDASRLQMKPLEPGAPLDLAQARNAVAIARLAGADRYATETFTKASQLLAEAEAARGRGRRGNELQQPARQAVQAAEDSRLIALRRQEEAFHAQQRAEAAERERLAQQQATAAQQEALEAQQRALAEAERRRQAELGAQAAAASRADAERARLEAERQTLAAQHARAEADAARAAADAERLRAEDARRMAEAQAQQAQAVATQSQQERDALRERLREQLNVVLETRETARGLIVNVSDVLFDTGKATLKPGARERLARVAGILLSQPDLHIQVEGHTDNVGSDAYNEQLSLRRAASVRAYLIENNIAPTAVGTAGFGETQPVATNGTAAGRQQNRRVELVVSGEAIGRTPTPLQPVR